MQSTVFESVWAEPNGFLIHHLNHSAMIAFNSINYYSVLIKRKRHQYTTKMFI